MYMAGGSVYEAMGELEWRDESDRVHHVMSCDIMVTHD